MKRLITSLIILAAASLLVVTSCADKNSTEACQYETSLNLDQGNYNAVLASSCATAMQKGAAYFGLAGFDITNVINRLIDANEANAPRSDLNVYMTSMIGRVTDTTLTNLDLSSAEYGAVPAASDIYQDAQFNLSLVNVIKSLSLLKLVSDFDGLGAVDSSCDANGNGNADEVDAAACALLFSTGEPCIESSTQIVLGTVADEVQGISLQGKSYNGYRGITITVSGTGTNTATCPSPNTYKKLLYFPATSWVLATTTADICQETAPGTIRTWPCPVETAAGQPLDLVTAVDTSLNNSVNSLNSSLTATTDSSVQESITDVKSQNCCTEAGEVWNPANPSSCTCSPEELARYLTTVD